MLAQNGECRRLLSQIEMHMNAILTGSQVYGTPTASSDIDMVVLVSQETLNLLAALVNEDEKMPKKGNMNSDGELEMTQLTARFGRLNIIVVTREEDWEAWRRGTGVLCRKALGGGTVSKELAIATMRGIREDVKNERLAERVKIGAATTKVDGGRKKSTVDNDVDISRILGSI